MNWSGGFQLAFQTLTVRTVGSPDRHRTTSPNVIDPERERINPENGGQPLLNQQEPSISKYLPRHSMLMSGAMSQPSGGGLDGGCGGLGGGGDGLGGGGDGLGGGGDGLGGGGLGLGGGGDGGADGGGRAVAQRPLPAQHTLSPISQSPNRLSLCSGPTYP